MAFCKNCGVEINEGTAFCPNCGTKQDNVNVASQPQNGVNAVYTYPSSSIIPVLFGPAAPNIDGFVCSFFFGYTV